MVSETETRQWRGSVCKGTVTCRWLGNLRVNRERIEVTSLLGQFSLPKDHTASIEPSRFFPSFWMGIRIRSTAGGDIRFSLFPPSNRQEVLKYLKSLGYPVS